MRIPVVLSAASLVGFLLPCGSIPVRGGPPSSSDTGQVRSFRWRTSGDEGLDARVTNVSSHGSISLQGTPQRQVAFGVTEGYYLMLAQFHGPRDPETQNMRLLRVKVSRVRQGNELTVEVPPEATRRLKKDDRVTLMRPVGSTTEQLRSIPAVSPLITKRDPRGLEGPEAEQTVESLKKIMVAFHNYHDVYGSFPPAAIYGPDGKPWHSWRILLAPFLDAAPVYNKYRFDEPWDGPNNKKLLDEIPKALQNPFEPSSHTNYVVVVGKGTAFPAKRATFNGKANPHPMAQIEEQEGVNTKIREFLDGTSNSLFVGTAPADAKIPWLKPQDLTLDQGFLKLGTKASFAMPFRHQGQRWGFVGFADGAVHAIPRSLSPETLRLLVTIADRKVAPRFPSVAAGRKPTHIQLDILRTEEGPRARLRELYRRGR